MKIMDKSIYDDFPYHNPKNAYMWGLIHGMIMIGTLLSIVAYVMI